ncbi:unnamed protein product [Dimorphilus gyrociliatus]|uniref:Uncharacterized protein n=1 Tax=Dimorphilus gyrociliatus TaxID=2664684 RepID=A0A7I8VX67_9ANNE|nr:unnamed protein product [Dimorphilus gyrociliatus]
MAFTSRTNSTVSSVCSLPFSYELNVIRHSASAILKRLNKLKLDYMDWWNRQNVSFVHSLRSLHISCSAILPVNHKLTTRNQFKTLLEAADKMTFTTAKINNIKTLTDFWARFLELYEEIEDAVQTPIRELFPGVYKSLMETYSRLIEGVSDDFDSRLCNEPFGYELGLAHEDYRHLIALLPYLLKLASNLCYVVMKLHIAKLPNEDSVEIQDV